MVKHRKNYLRAFISLLIANYLIVYPFGISILSLYIGIKKAMLVGILPFIIPDLMKNLAVIKIAKIFKFHEKL